MLDIYKASAGSGKTFTLAYLYIKYILSRRLPDGSYTLNRSPRSAHRSVLAITFTNKATEEMKTRIIHELALLAGLEPGWEQDSGYASMLMHDLHCDRKALQECATIALRQLLFDFNLFNVSTIDSFFQVILRSFAREAELTGNYDVDLDKNYAISQAVGRMLTAINRGDNDDPSDPGNRRLKKWILDYLDYGLTQGKSFNFLNRNSSAYTDLLRFLDNTMDEVFESQFDRFKEYLSDPTRTITLATGLRKRISSIAAEAGKTALDVINEADRIGLAPKNGLNSNAFNPFVKWVKQGKLDNKPSATFKSLIENPSGIFTAATLKKVETGKVDGGDLALLASRSAAAICRCISDSDLYNALLGNLYVLGLISRIMAYLAEYRAETSTILLSDTNTLLAKIIGDDPTPFIYERIGLWFRHYLIDEFQDTSRLQWQNLKPLIAESIAGGNGNLVIGDEKQCIYRFRNSDPTLLTGLQSEFPNDAILRGNNPGDNTNWRSAADIVNFNNAFFKALTTTPLEKLYSNVEQNISPKHSSHRGYVKLFPNTIDSNGLALSNVSDIRRNAYRITANEIKRQIDAGYLGGEIAVLFRKNSEGAEFIKYIMSLSDSDPSFPKLRIASEDSLLIANSPSVRLVISILRFVVSSDYVGNERKTSRREIARLLNCFEKARTSGAQVSDALAYALENRGIDDETPSKMTTYDQAVTLPALIKKIILTLHDGKECQSDENAYLTALLDLAADFSSNGKGDVRSFVEWWDSTGAAKATIVAGEDRDALRVLTIHKAKGLGFRCVHIPFLDGKSVDSKIHWFKPVGLDWLDHDCIPPLLPIKMSKKLGETAFAEQYNDYLAEDTIDAVNVMYVAFTRAIDELIVGYNPERGEPGGSMLINDALARIDHAACKVDDDGLVTAGQPTLCQGHDSSRGTAMEPTATIVMPGIKSRRGNNDAWNDTELDTDRLSLDQAGEPEIIAEIISRLHDISRLPRTMRQLIANGSLNADRAGEIEEVISEAISHHDVRRWFDGSGKVACRRLLDIGDGKTMRIDRIVWYPDGNVDIIDIIDPRPGSDSNDNTAVDHESPKRAIMARRRRLLDSGMSNVSAWLWRPGTAPEKVSG